MVRLIFEDNENSAVSMCLLKSCFGSNIHFSNSCNNIKKTYNKLNDIYKNDFFIIFFDMCPDNMDTVGTFNDLYRFVSDKDNVIVIPIICIEYIVLQFLYCNDFLRNESLKPVHRNIIENTIVKFDYKALDIGIYPVPCLEAVF